MLTTTDSPQPPTDAPPPTPAAATDSAEPAPSDPPPAPPETLTIGGEMLERLRAFAARTGLTVEKFIESVLSSGGAKREPVPFEPSNVDDMYRYARMLAGASLLPRAYYDRDDRERKHPKISDVHFVLLKGQQLGLHPMVAISQINIIDGKAEVGALLMVSLCRRSGLCEYFTLVSSDERQATYKTKRRGEPSEVVFTYTIEEADQMGLLDKGRTDWAKENNQWKKQPRTMLRRRAQSMLAREVYPDIVMGLYDHDEIAEMREREVALGIDPDRVIQVDGAGLEQSNGVPMAPPEAAREQPALPPPGELVSLRAPAQREAVTVPVARPKTDGLKERLKERGQGSFLPDPPADGRPPLGYGEVYCKCGVPVVGVKGELCDACKRS